MTDLELEYEADKVKDEPTLLLFVKLLIAHREQEISKQSSSDKNGLQVEDPWANLATEDFLRAMVSWSEATPTSPEVYRRPTNPWTRFAHMIFVGLISVHDG